MQTTARNATLEDLANLLSLQHARKLDVVAPASAIRSEDGLLRIVGAEPVIDDEGVTVSDGLYRPTSICDEGIAEKLKIPVQYLKALRASRPDLYDANVNGWLHGSELPLPGTLARAEADGRSFLVRCFRGDRPEDGVARAFLSDSFKIIDNLDVLGSVLEGVKEAGTEVRIDGCDLSDRRMYVRIAAPEIQALAPALLGNYRSPFSGETGAANPVVFAGLVAQNSETGSGAWQIAPRITIRICSNGMTMTKDALRAVHLGGKLEEGIVRWSTDTMEKTLELVKAQTRDAVRTFLDVDYVTSVIERLEEGADKKLDKPLEVVQSVGSQLRLSKERIDSIVDFFVKGGDTNATGVLHAVTATAQTVEDADEAADLEGMAIRAYELALSA